jgi:hypothetical protein
MSGGCGDVAGQEVQLFCRAATAGAGGGVRLGGGDGSLSSGSVLLVGGSSAAKAARCRMRAVRVPPKAERRTSEALREPTSSGDV